MKRPGPIKRRQSSRHTPCAVTDPAKKRSVGKDLVGGPDPANSASAPSPQYSGERRSSAADLAGPAAVGKLDSSPTLSQLVSINFRFVRSISLVRDADRPDAYQGYILTPNARDILFRLAAALRDESPTRAWSLTGPYGSGKSAFALFGAQLLAGEERPRLNARSLLSADQELTAALFGPGAALAKRAARLCPVLVTGSRQPLAKALAASLAATLRRLVTRGRPPQLLEQLEKLAGQANPSSSEVVAGFEAASAYLARVDADSAGLLVIIDELGKFLEYGAASPELGDVFILQELAEAAARSPRPFLVLTILHQALDRYADHVSPTRRAEWAKVQGRFEDIAC